MQAATGSGKTVEEVRAMMERAMQQHIFRLQEVLMEAGYPVRPVRRAARHRL